MKSWQEWGQLASRALNEVANSADALELARRLGTEMSPEEATVAQQKLKEIGNRAAAALGKAMNMGDTWQRTGPTGWRWKLIFHITHLARDPDKDVAQWFAGQTPLGIKKEIVSRGIFPTAGPTKAQEASAEYLAARGEERQVSNNYKSFHDYEAESRKELDRLVQEGHLERIGPWHEVVAKWPEAIATKLATLVKQKPDGTQKIRFIADMRRSGVNAIAVARERIVLPRGTDLVRDVLDLQEAAHGNVELYTADFTDAFLNLGIHSEERGYTVVKSGDAEYSSYSGVPFGLATAPLLWGRAAAWIGRAT